MFSQISLMTLIILQQFSPNISGQLFKIKSENLNKRLTGYKLFEKQVSGPHECASECMFLGACKSVNYISSTKTCEFNSKGSVTVDGSDFEGSMRIIFSDINEWPQSMVFGCADHACGHAQRCFPLGNDAYKCVDVVCDDPAEIPHYGVKQPGSNIAGSVRTYELTCPQGMVVKGDTNVTCLLNGEWSPLTAYCKVKTVGENCTSIDDCVESGSECILGKCFCGRLYRYDDDMKDCVKICSEMTDTFTAQALTRIVGYNYQWRDRERNITLQDCRQLCIDDVDCLSFEYGQSGDYIVCRGSLVSSGMIEDALPNLLSSAPFDVYSRACT